MAPPEKTTQPLNRPSSPSASSSDESEEIVKNKNVEDTESEDDDSQQSGDKSGSDSDSDSDSHERTPSPTASDFAVKPIASKPMDNKKPNKNPTPKQTQEPKPGSKRPAKDPNPNPNEKSGSGKNKKVKVEEEKRTTNYRLWSEDDEVAIMKGVLDFKTKRGSDAFTDRGAFYEFVKKSFSVDVAQSQLWDKARRMKKKYQGLLENRVNGDEDPVFQKPVEYKCYQLAKKIWGNSDGNAIEGSAKSSANTKKKPTNTNATNKSLKSDNPLASPKPESKAKSKAITLPEKNSKANGVVEDGNKVDEDDFYSMFPELVGSLGAENVSLSVPEEVANVVKEKMPLIGAVKAKELEERWKNLRAEQIRLFLKQLDLVREQTKMVLDAMEASKA